MSINVSQLFVRYPDPQDAADLLADVQRADPGSPSFLAVKTPSPWLAVSSGDNMPAPGIARRLSRALEAEALWYGLAGSILAYRFIRYALGREEEKELEPAELFGAARPFPLPAYRDVEREVHRRIREAGLPADYVHLFIEEIGVAGGAGGPEDAAVVREGRIDRFAHRVPKRTTDAVRTLFDEVDEGEGRVTDRIELKGTFDADRGKRLLGTLEEISRRRTVPPGWRVRYRAGTPEDPDLFPSLAGLHARGGYSFDFEPEPA